MAGRAGDAEQAYRDAAAGGHETALTELARWLRAVPGRESDGLRLQQHGVE